MLTTEQEDEYLLSKLTICINADSTVRDILTKELIGIIYKRTGDDPMSVLLESYDTNIELNDVSPSDDFDIKDISRDTLISLLEIIL